MSVFDDDRFKHILTDPKFQGVPKKEKKVVIDKRFQSMFTDKKFQLDYKVDKRGRPIKHSHVEDYHNFYELQSDSDDNDDDDDDKGSTEPALDDENTHQADRIANDKDEPLKDSQEAGSSDVKPTSFDAIEAEERRKRRELKEKKKELIKKDTEIVDEFVKSKISDETRERLLDPSVDYARGLGSLFSDSSSDEITSSDSEDEIVHDWGELDRDAEKTEDATCRLAACNMDWDRVGAKDLMVLFNSFVPAGGIIKSVTIYPSEFGLARMKEEDLKGPTELINLKEDDSDFEDEKKNDDEEEISEGKMEKLREYQLKRLKYFYAVVEFDSAETANKVYSECDGMEYESSATKLDLRFIPDDMVFDQEPKESCTELPEGGKYLPRIFANSALQQGTVRLTWDETDPDRIEVVRRAATGQLDEDKARAYLALSSDDDYDDDEKDSSKEDEKNGEKVSGNESESEDENTTIKKYRNLLAEIQKKEEEKKKGKVEMEISWDLTAANNAQEKEETAKEQHLTPFEKMMKKKRDRRNERFKKKDDDDLLSDDDIPSDVDLNDPFFKDELGPEASKLKKKMKSKGKAAYKDESDNEESLHKKAELDLLLSEENVEGKGKSHFNLKAIQKAESEENSKKKKRKRNKISETKILEDDFKIDLKDERFSALFSSHHYNIDPADSHFKRTKAMDDIISEKIKRRKTQDIQEIKKNEPLGKKDSSTLSPELSVLVKSVKTKAKRSK